jgi:DDE family transposase
MYLTRIPQRVSNCLAKQATGFDKHPQAQHFRILCWILVLLILCHGSATLKNLTRCMPVSLRYWTILRMVRARYWDPYLLVQELARDVLLHMPPPTDATLYLIADTTIIGKTGKQQPLAHYTRMNQHEPFTFGLSLLLLIAQWGSLRIPLDAVLLDPAKKGEQNIQFRHMLRRFVPPPWCHKVVVLADAGFASKANLRLIQRRGYKFVFSLPRSWKFLDGTHLRDLARHLPKSLYHRVASYTPQQRRKDYWVFVRRGRLKIIGDVTILLSKRRRNDGPKQVKLIVTNLDSPTATEILNIYSRRWAVEVTFKELKSHLHMGQMQVSKEAGRVKHAMLFPVMAYLLLLRLYGRDIDAEKGISVFALKQQFTLEVCKEQLDRSENKWRKKLDKLRVAA